MTTIQNVASHAGVSIGTVDRVIHRRGKVAPATEARILRAIDELGYTPNVFARNLKLGKTYRFGVLIPERDKDGGYWTLPEQGIQKAAHELASHHVQVVPFYFDKYHDSHFRDLQAQIQTADLDGLLIAPILTASITALIQSLSESCPYVFIDSDLPDLRPIAVINQDAYQSGRAAADLMHRVLHRQGPIMVVKIIPDDYHINARVQGFVTFMRGVNRNVSIHEADVGRDPESVHKLVREFHQNHPDLKGIFVTNALTFMVAEALSQQHSETQPVLIGYDLIPANAEWLKKGLIDFLITQRPEMQGYQGIYALFRHVVLKEQPAKKTMIPLDIITRETIHYQFINPE